MLQRRTWFIYLLIACTLLLVAVAWLLKENRDTRSQLNSLRDNVQSLREDTEFQTRMLSGNLSYGLQQLQPVIEPKENRMYLPELRISIPVNNISRSLYYTYNQGIPGDDSGDARVTSSYITEQPKDEVMSCSDTIRLQIEDKPDAYSPSQPHYATVKLSDGRKLQIYVSAHDGCKVAWALVSPEQIADEFKKAKSY